VDEVAESHRTDMAFFLQLPRGDAGAYGVFVNVLTHLRVTVWVDKSWQPPQRPGSKPSNP
jgi:hypothetical protein